MWTHHCASAPPKPGSAALHSDGLLSTLFVLAGRSVLQGVQAEIRLLQEEVKETGKKRLVCLECWDFGQNAAAVRRPAAPALGGLDEAGLFSLSPFFTPCVVFCVLNIQCNHVTLFL